MTTVLSTPWELGRREATEARGARVLACPTRRGAGDDRHGHRQPLLDHIRSGCGPDDDGQHHRRGDEGRSDATRQCPAASRRPHGAAQLRGEPRVQGGGGRRLGGGDQEENWAAVLRTCNGWMAPPQNKNLRRVRMRAAKKGAWKKRCGGRRHENSSSSSSSQQIMTTISRVASVI